MLFHSWIYFCIWNNATALGTLKYCHVHSVLKKGIEWNKKVMTCFNTYFKHYLCFQISLFGFRSDPLDNLCWNKLTSCVPIFPYISILSIILKYLMHRLKSIDIGGISLKKVYFWNNYVLVTITYKTKQKFLWILFVNKTFFWRNT